MVALAEEAGDVTVVATPQTSDQVVTVLAQTEVEVLVLDEELGPLPVLELARQLQEKHPAVGLLLLAAGEASPDLLRQALRAGFRDVLSAPLTVEALDDATKRAASWARAVRERSEADDLARSPSTSAAQIIAIAGAKGGVGCSTVALHVALAAAGHDAERPVRAGRARPAGRRPALAAGPPEPPQHRRPRGRRGRRDHRALARRHALRALLGAARAGRARARRGRGGRRRGRRAPDPRRAEVPVRHRRLRRRSVMTEAGAVAVEMASNVLVVTTPDVPAIRATNRLLRLWERLQIDTPARVLLNRTSREHEIQPDFARRVMHAPVLDTTIRRASATSRSR